jgi:hypothetical protein
LQAFALSFIAYGLVKAIPPFWLAIIATLLTYTLGPIVTRQLSDLNRADIEHVITQNAKRAVDTASSVMNRTASTAEELKNYTKETASYTADRAAEMGQEIKNRALDTASATDRVGAKGQGTGAQPARDSAAAPPNALSTDQEGMSKDRRTQLHPMQSGDVNIAL